MKLPLVLPALSLTGAVVVMTMTGFSGTTVGAVPAPAAKFSARAVALHPELGKADSPFRREFLRRLNIYSAENAAYTAAKDWDLSLAEEVKKNLESFAEKPAIEFKVLLIIKRCSDTRHPLFLPVRSEMTKEDIAKARHCFEIQTPDMVHDITRGKVKFTPTVVVSDIPLRVLDPGRRDSAEYMASELEGELASIAKPGDYDSAGYYFLPYDNASGYRIPRAGYGVGGYNREAGIGMLAISSAASMNPRDEVFLHEWMHGLDGYYGGKPGVKLPKGALHGGKNYDAHYSAAKAWRPRDSFRGYMEWYADIFNRRVPDGDGFVGYGDEAWKYGPIRAGAKSGSVFRIRPVDLPAYPQWVYDLMKGDTANARLGRTLIPAGMRAGAILKRAGLWNFENWSRNEKTVATYAESDGGTFTLDSPVAADAAIRYDIPLDPSSNYVFSAEVKTTGIRSESPEGKLPVRLEAGNSKSLRDFSGSVNWTRVVLPFTTKPDQATATLRMQIGGSGNRASGRVSFRKVTLQKVDWPVATDNR